MAMFLTRLLLEGVNHPSVYAIGLLPAITMIFIYSTYKAGNYDRHWMFLAAVAAVLLPIRVMTTGGPSSPVGVWFGLITLSYAVTAGKKATPYTLAMIFILFAFYFANKSFQIFDPTTATTAILYSVFQIGFVAYFLLLLATEKNRNLIFEELKIQEDSLNGIRERIQVLEKEKSQLAMIATYNHELNNPLMIALLAVDQYAKHKDQKSLSKLKRALIRIDSLIEKIDAIGENSKVEYTPYTPKSLMIDINKDAA